VSTDEQMGEWLAQALASADDARTALDDAYQHLVNLKLVNKVKVGEYRCHKGCTLVTVVRLGVRTLARTTPTKYGRDLNAQRSVETARAKNTLDGDHHWPSYTFDVDALAETPSNGFEANCWHKLRTIKPADVLDLCANVLPGKPGKPSII